MFQPDNANTPAQPANEYQLQMPEKKTVENSIQPNIHKSFSPTKWLKLWGSVTFDAITDGTIQLAIPVLQREKQTLLTI